MTWGGGTQLGGRLSSTFFWPQSPQKTNTAIQVIPGQIHCPFKISNHRMLHPSSSFLKFMLRSQSTFLSPRLVTRRMSRARLVPTWTWSRGFQWSHLHFYFTLLPVKLFYTHYIIKSYLYPEDNLLSRFDHLSNMMLQPGMPFFKYLLLIALPLGIRNFYFQEAYTFRTPSSLTPPPQKKRNKNLLIVIVSPR